MADWKFRLGSYFVMFTTTPSGQEFLLHLPSPGCPRLEGVGIGQEGLPAPKHWTPHPTQMWNRTRSAWLPARLIVARSSFFSFFNFLAKSNLMQGRAERPVTGRWHSLVLVYLLISVTISTPHSLAQRFFPTPSYAPGNVQMASLPPPLFPHQ